MWCYNGLTFVDLKQSHNYNEAQGQELPDSEDILNACGQTHTEAVHPCEKYCKHSYTQTHETLDLQEESGLNCI